MFPPTWDPTQAIKKKRKTFVEECENQAMQNLPPVPFQSSLQQTIMRRLNASEPPPNPNDLQLDHILSRLPYRSMLENLFQTVDPHQEFPKEVPILSRAYEESFMRQPMPNEKQCAMADLCECMQVRPSVFGPGPHRP
jgi:hypothetical protein